MNQIEHHATRLPAAAHEIVVPAPHAEAESAASQIREYLQLLRRRWRLIAGFALGAAFLMGIVCVLATPLYRATAVLHIQSQAPQVTNLQGVVGGPNGWEGIEFFQDQVKILESRTLAASVIRELALGEDPRFTEPKQETDLLGEVFGVIWRIYKTARNLVASPPSASKPHRAAEAQGSGGDAETASEPFILGVPSYLIGWYRSDLDVTPIPNTRLVQVSFTSPYPELAQQIANAHVSHYIRRSLQAKFELTGEARRFLEAEIDRVQAELLKAERALNEFRRANRVISLDEKENAVSERLTDLARRLTEAEADRIAAESQYRLVQNREYELLPEVLQNSLISSLKAEVSRIEIRHAELRQTFLEKSPQLAEVTAQLRQARARLDREIARVVGGVESVYLAAKAKEDSLRAEFERQQETMLNLKEISGQYIKLDQTVNTTRNLYNTLLTRLQETEVVKGSQLSNASVMDAAELPGWPVEPNVPMSILFATIFGLVVGTGVSLLLENVDTSFKTPEDVRRSLRLPTLGVVPDFALSTKPVRSVPYLGRAAGSNARPARGPASRVQRPTSLPAEAYRSIRTSLLFMNPAAPPRTLLVTSSQPREGKTATTVNLAISLAQLGNRVVLVDADMRQPRCHRALGIAQGPGLAEVLRGKADLETALVRVPLENDAVPDGGEDGAGLYLLQSGLPPGDPAELLASARMREVLATLREHFDMVLVDSPPVFPITDSAILAPVVDGVVLVVRGHRTDRRVIAEALERLRLMKAHVVGVVLNGVDPASSHYSRYSYYFAA